MEDQSIGDTIKDILKKALSSVVGTLSEVAKENCERIAQKAEESVEEATEAKSSLDALMDSEYIGQFQTRSASYLILLRLHKICIPTSPPISICIYRQGRLVPPT